MKSPTFEDFVELVRVLRGPAGCPWDREQTHDTLKPMLLEEAYEVVEAIEAQDDKELASELGDLLLQVVFHAQVASETNRFNISHVIATIHDKMVRRHPHVFADVEAGDSAEVLRNWEAIKAKEKGEKNSMLDSVSKSMPALMEAFQLTTRAARVRFDWPDVASCLEKLDEEVDELKAEIASEKRDAIADEVGDLLFVAVNLARLLEIDPESALKRANRKFRERFAYIERALAADGRKPDQSSLDEMERLWQEAKHQTSREIDS